MAVTLDRRTRLDSGLRRVEIEDFVPDEFPDLVARHGELVAQGIEALDAPPLALEIGERAWSFFRTGTTIAASPGIRAGAVVVTFGAADFSDWVQNQRSFNAMMTARELRYRGGERDISVWDSLWLTLLEGWPVVADIGFVDRHGAPLGFGRVFTPGDDPADIAHFLREAGFVHGRGWVDPADTAVVPAEMDRALPDHHEGDGRSWWATLRNGTRQCVRLQEFVDRSPRTAAILRSEHWDQLRSALSDGLSNVEIADRLVISPATAKTHVNRAMAKTGARDRAQLVVLAYQNGLANLR